MTIFIAIDEVAEDAKRYGRQRLIVPQVFGVGAMYGAKTDVANAEAALKASPNDPKLKAALVEAKKHLAEVLKAKAEWDKKFGLPPGDEFKEADHPRDDSGKFGSGGGGSAPLKMSSLKKVGGQLGSNPGGVYEGDGKKYYIKKGRSKDHVKNELVAGNLYNLAGAKTVKYQPVEGGDYIATEWETPEKKTAREFTPAELKEAQKDFAVHAWTANWDAAGLDYDNQMLIGGKPTSVDLGGALNYRAQGAPKGNAFGDKVGEWDTLRDPKMNPQNAKMFKGMTDQQLKESAQKVIRIPDEKIKAATEGDKALGDKLIARKRDIAKRVGLMASDEKDFKESDHPRGKGGKFAKSGTGGGSSAGGGGEEDDDDDEGEGEKKSPEGHRVAKPVRKVLKNAGFVKIQGGKDEIKFAHTGTGMRVIIHKNPESLKSDIFTIKAPSGKEVASKGAKQLSVALAQLLASEAAKDPVGGTPTAPAPKPAQAPSPMGAQKAPAAAPEPKKFVNTPPYATAAELKEAAGAETFLSEKGYKPVEENKEYSILKAPNGALIHYNHESNNWVASAPGKMTKEGNGFENLQKLLSGEKFPSPALPPWKNSSVTIKDPTTAKQTASAKATQATKSQQEDHYNGKLSPAAPTATPEEKEALSSYTGSGYSSINDSLRHTPSFAKSSKVVKHLDTYLAKSSFPEDITLFRKVSGNYAKILQSIVVEGGKFIDRGYSSTSSVEGVWHGDLKMIITVKKGSKGAAVKKYSNHKSEYEVLLPRNSGYLVTKYDEGSGELHVTLDQSHFKD